MTEIGGKRTKYIKLVIFLLPLARLSFGLTWCIGKSRIFQKCPTVFRSIVSHLAAILKMTETGGKRTKYIKRVILLLPLARLSVALTWCIGKSRIFQKCAYSLSL